MGKSRACGFDIFALNDIIDNEKLSVLYQASLTECAPNDPFNDWSKVIDSIINIYLDIIDRISSEQTDLEISDELSDYEGNYIIDDWEIIRFVSDVIDGLSEDAQFIDSDNMFDEFILTDDWITKFFIYSDFIDSENSNVEFIDDIGDNVIEDYFEELNFDIIDSESPSVYFVIENEDFWEFNIIDS